MRTFVPASELYTGSVSRWTWTRSRGLQCHYIGGLVCKSDWGTLREFLKAVREGREARVTEIVGIDLDREDSAPGYHVKGSMGEKK